MFVPFLYELRDRGVKVGPRRRSPAGAGAGDRPAQGTLDGFYEVARALCVHREQDLDAFDRAFGHHFRGVPDDALALTEELLQWLEQPVEMRQLTEEEKQILDRLDLAEARERLAGGSSSNGAPRWRNDGSAREERRRTAAAGGIPPGSRWARRPVAGARWRSPASAASATALRRHPGHPPRRGRAPAAARLRPGGSAGRTGRGDHHRPHRPNAGSWRSPCAPRAGRTCAVLLLLDVGGSMDPHADVSERLFSAAKRATHFKSCARTTSTTASTAASTRAPPCSRRPRAAAATRLRSLLAPDLVGDALNRAALS